MVIPIYDKVDKRESNKCKSVVLRSILGKIMTEILEKHEKKIESVG